MHLKHVVTRHALGEELLPALGDLVQVLLEEFEDEVEDVLLADDLLELDDVGVLHLAQ